MGDAENDEVAEKVGVVENVGVTVSVAEGVAVDVYVEDAV